MTIQNFNPEEFSRKLAQEAQGMLPNDLNDYQKKFVINKLYNFCKLAGDAINNDESLNFTVNQANVIVQLIGEWTFHKNIDLMRAKVPEECWDPVLQQVAFAVFETAKTVEIKKIEPNKALKMIEDIVKDAYNKSLMELARTGKIEEGNLPEILSYSNVDEMSKQDQPEMSKSQENMLLKCASLALVLKTLPENKIRKILSGMDQEIAKQIVYFINMPDLQQRIDLKVANNFLSSIKKNITLKSVQRSVLEDKIYKLKDLYDENLIMKHIKFERPIIKQFVHNCLSKKHQDAQISPYIENVVYEYLISKLTA